MGHQVVMAPKYMWNQGDMSATLKYVVTQNQADSRYRNPTKRQQKEGVARRALQAATGVLPMTGAREDRRFLARPRFSLPHCES